MNNIKVSKEEIIDKALEIALEEGLDKINIRKVARECNVSVGCVYYHFSNKAQIVINVITIYWDSVFKPIIESVDEYSDFIEFINFAYKRVYDKLANSNIYTRSHMNMFSKDDREEGSKSMKMYIGNLMKLFVKVMDSDKNVDNTIWTDSFSKNEFAMFVFSNMFLCLEKREEDIEYLDKIIKSVIYKKEKKNV